MFQFIKKIIPTIIFLSTISAISFGLNSTNYCQPPKKVWKIAIFRTKPPYAIEQEKELKKSLKRLGYVEGKTISILTAERLALNFMQRMSGIATQTNKIVHELEGLNTKVLTPEKQHQILELLIKWL